MIGPILRFLPTLGRYVTQGLASIGLYEFFEDSVHDHSVDGESATEVERNYITMLVGAFVVALGVVLYVFRKAIFKKKRR